MKDYIFGREGKGYIFEIVEQELLDYFNDRGIPLELKYRQHYDT